VLAILSERMLRAVMALLVLARKLTNSEMVSTAEVNNAEEIPFISSPLYFISSMEIVAAMRGELRKK
jgi:hypothetical protein